MDSRRLSVNCLEQKEIAISVLNRIKGTIGSFQQKLDMFIESYYRLVIPIPSRIWKSISIYCSNLQGLDRC